MEVMNKITILNYRTTVLLPQLRARRPIVFKVKSKFSYLLMSLYKKLASALPASIYGYENAVTTRVPTYTWVLARLQ